MKGRGLFIVAIILVKKSLLSDKSILKMNSKETSFFFKGGSFDEGQDENTKIYFLLIPHLT